MDPAAAIWRRTAHLPSWKLQWTWRSGAIAIGFTTLPQGRDGEGMLLPVGWFFTEAQDFVIEFPEQVVAILRYVLMP